jgi:hypothetical protein
MMDIQIRCCESQSERLSPNPARLLFAMLLSLGRQHNTECSRWFDEMCCIVVSELGAKHRATNIVLLLQLDQMLAIQSQIPLFT